MGIPHLLHHLQPYATKVFLTPSDHGNQQEPPESTSRHAIIDGPALAYHVYYICVNKREGARNAFEVIPSYRELGSATLAWLDQIQQYDVKMYVQDRYD